MKVLVKTFQELSTAELYAVLQLRSAIFVVEQECIYQDIDGKDAKAIHVLGYLDEELIAYTRVFGPGDYFDQASIGRVAVRESHRGKGLGYQIMEASIEAVRAIFDTQQITLSAQLYLKDFYADMGFKPEGPEYKEDGIPHIRMEMRP